MYDFEPFILTIHWCCHIILFISVRYFKFAIVRVSCGLVFFLTHPLRWIEEGDEREGKDTKKDKDEFID